jgi:Ran GTPase-activating protein (RanGAP) involved in mRNA processing and transport
LRPNTTLKELDLSNNRLGNEGAIELVKHLDMNGDAKKETKPTLRELQVNGCDIGCKGAAFLVRCERYTDLRLRGNYINEDDISLAPIPWNTSDDALAGMTKIGEALSRNKVMQLLDLAGNRLGDEGLRAMNFVDPFVNNQVRGLPM